MSDETILVISDIHSNLVALEAVLTDAAKHGPFGRKGCLGDIVGYGPQPNEVIRRLVEEGFFSDGNFVIRGNHDRAVTGGDCSLFNMYALTAAAHNQKALTAENLEYLRALQTLYLDPEGLFAAVHGSFYGEWEDDYVVTDEEAHEAMHALRFKDDQDPTGHRHYRIGLSGHSHIPMDSEAWIHYDKFKPGDWFNGTERFRHHTGHSRTGRLFTDTQIVIVDLGSAPDEDPGWKQKILFNPGSVGQPRNKNPAAQYGIVRINGETVQLEFHRAAYDVTEAQRRIRDAGLPDWLAERLERGE